MHKYLTAVGRICQYGWDTVKPCLHLDALNQCELNRPLTWQRI